MRICWLFVLACIAVAGCRPGAPTSARAADSTREESSVASIAPAAPAATADIRTGVGFRSGKQLDEHFAKHGREFRGLSKQQYLRSAQDLRDKPVGGDVEEILRSDGSSSRFDRASGAFLAFNRDGTIRTFFKPNDGENYFRRQAQRSH